jgi:hypothetical protein
MHLLRFLGHSTLLASDVAADIREIRGLLNTGLERAPSLARNRWRALVGELGINSGSELSDGTLDEAALGDASTEEDGVDGHQDPRALLEEQSRSEDAEPESDLEDSNECHAAIVVLLDELSNRLRCARRLRLGALGRRRRLKSGEQVGADIGQDVEDGVDGKGENSQGNLAREQPYQCHDCSTC